MERQSISRNEIEEVDIANWYKYTLECEHSYYTRVRIKIPVDYSYMEHFVRCTKSHDSNTPTQWIPVKKMEAVTDDHVRNVSDGFAFIVPGRIMRTIAGNPSGSPFPYTSGDRDY